MSRQSPFLTLILAVFSIALVVALVANPETSFQAALRGLKIWWDVVFPATLPFIVVSEMLMGFGVVHFAGVLLEPLMRPFFNVPGTGGFVLTMGFASGYPVAAKLTSRLREEGSITRAEGERLVSFTTTGDPLFVIGAVAIGFFHSEQLAVVIACSHYASALILGLFYRFHNFRAPSSKWSERSKRPLLMRALQAMHRARLRDGRPFGQLMGDAVNSALHTLMMIGGFIIVFSVLIQLFSITKLTDLLSAILSLVLGPFGFPVEFSNSLVSGLLEVTLGSQSASDVTQVPLVWKAAIASAIVSWGGLSVHAQVASILSKTDIRVAPFLIGRAIHAAMAGLMTFLIWKPLTLLTKSSVTALPVFLYTQESRTIFDWLDTFSLLSLAAFAIGLFFFVLFLVVKKLFNMKYN